MKIIQTKDIKYLDAQTIKEKNITSFELMQDAVHNFEEEMWESLCKQDAESRVVVVAGSGNNGGDAMVWARLFLKRMYKHDNAVPIELEKKLVVYLVNPKKKLSIDCQKAYEELEELHEVVEIQDAEEIRIERNDVIIDGLFGSGLNRPLGKPYSEIVKKINRSEKRYVVSIDLPSGMMGEDNDQNDKESIICADKTIMLGTPKLCRYMEDNYKLGKDFLGNVVLTKVMMSEVAIEELSTDYYTIDKELIARIKHKRPNISHKGTYGHALIVAGSFGMMGAAVLATKSALRSGCGLVTVHIPERGYDIMQISVPEAIVSLDDNERWFTKVGDTQRYSSVGVGPGIGQREESYEALKDLLKQCTGNVVMDADALNLLSQHRDLWDYVPEKTILTPHPKEFERLFGKCPTSFQRLQTQREMSRRHRVIIVLKGWRTSVSLPDGTVYFNETGNSGLSTAGSGDVLTGVITSLLAQRYQPEEAAMMGVWAHGRTTEVENEKWKRKENDVRNQHQSEESMIARDIIENLGIVWDSI